MYRSNPSKHIMLVLSILILSFSYLPLIRVSINRSLLSDSQYPAMAATAPIKMEVNTRSPLAASVASAHSTTPKNICCRTSISSSWMLSKKTVSSPAEEKTCKIRDILKHKTSFYEKWNILKLINVKICKFIHATLYDIHNTFVNKKKILRPITVFRCIALNFFCIALKITTFYVLFRKTF